MRPAGQALLKTVLITKSRLIVASLVRQSVSALHSHVGYFDFVEAYGSLFKEASAGVFSFYSAGIREEPADVIGAQRHNSVAVSAELGRDPSFVDSADGLKVRAGER